MNRRRVVVVGAGVGGLAASIHLAQAGFDVLVLEKNPTIGGKLNQCTLAHPHRPDDRPFTFDTGPSLLTLPFIFEELFQAAGATLSEHLELMRLDPIARYRWSDGAQFEARAMVADLEAEIARIAPADLLGWRRLAARGRFIWDLTGESFLRQAPEQMLKGNGDRFAGLKMLAMPFRIGMFQRFSRLINTHIRDPRLREIWYQYATYSGASPFRAPATLAVIPHAEFAFGGWYVRGGLYRIAQELGQRAQHIGVRLETNAEVEQILIESSPARAVSAVRLKSGRQFPCDAVVANSDVVHTYRAMIDPPHRPRYTDRTLAKLDPGGSGMVLMLGVEGTYPQLAHHNKFMPRDYRSDLKSMFETHNLPNDPCIYVCASSRTDPQTAPPGCENLFVLCSAPALNGKIDWSNAQPAYRNQIVRTLEERWGLTDLSRRIVVERCMTPADLKRIYNANAGSIYGIGSNSLRTAFLKPPNRDRDVRGLYFAGGATHPGGGLPLVALSGKIAAELVQEDFS